MVTMNPSAAARSRGLVPWWHGATAAIAAVALVGQIVLVVDSGDGLLDFFSYFTIQSNLLVLATSVVLATGREPDSRGWRVLRLAALVGITVTGLVYATLIGPYVSFEGITWWYDKAFHYVVPLLAVVGHVWVGPRPRFVPADLVVLAWPVAWLAYTLARSEWGDPSFAANDGSVSRVPYDFLSTDLNGAGSVAVTCVGLTLGMLLVAGAYIRWSHRDRPAA